MRAILSASIWLICLAVTPAFMLLKPAPLEGLVLVLHGPWTNGAHLVETAGGHPVGPLLAPMATMANGGPEFISAVRRAGAWGVSDATLIAQICGVEL